MSYSLTMKTVNVQALEYGWLSWTWVFAAERPSWRQPRLNILTIVFNGLAQEPVSIGQHVNERKNVKINGLFVFVWQTIVTGKGDLRNYFLAGRSMTWWPVSKF